MTKITNVELIEKMVEKLKPVLELEHWKIKVRESKKRETTITGMITASIEPMPCYQEAVLTFYPYLLDNEKKEIELIILHELCHCLTKDYSNLLNRIFHNQLVTIKEEHLVNERLTSWIARLVTKNL